MWPGGEWQGKKGGGVYEGEVMVERERGRRVAGGERVIGFTVHKQV